MKIIIISFNFIIPTDSKLFVHFIITIIKFIIAIILEIHVFNFQ